MPAANVLSTAPARICTGRQVRPTIYAYTHPNYERHRGWVKIGYVEVHEERNVEKRIREQNHTSDIEFDIKWHLDARYEGDGPFTDKSFHEYLRKLGYEQKCDDREGLLEFFRIDSNEAKNHLYDFRLNRGIVSEGNVQGLGAVTPYTLKDEQEEAVRNTCAYRDDHPGGHFLWNAKPRMGKTLACYEFVKRIGAKKVLILTNRPAIADSWYHDYAQFMGTASGYLFVSNASSLQGATSAKSLDAKEYALVVSREQYEQEKQYGERNCIEFVSLQDLKGSLYFGGDFDKLKEVKEQTWDVVIVDESHEGVDTAKSDIIFDTIKRGFTLHLSGTPFKALANEKFPEHAIYNWTYADEQKRKRERSDDPAYANQPQLNLFTYKMSDIVRGKLEQGLELDGKSVDYAFDLNEFFRVNNDETNRGRFVHDAAVGKFLDALTRQKKYPFSTPELRAELKHTLWLLNRVDSAKALQRKLKNHPVFKDYEVVLAAGDGKAISENDEVDEVDYTATKTALEAVRQAIKTHEYTITLSVGKLTTGVTVPEWTGVLMLSSIQSPSLYMQTAFRCQNPHLFVDGEKSEACKRKTDAYVFDFDPARTLEIYEKMANDLFRRTSGSNNSLEERKQRVRELLNFFPVVGEDDEGEMVELDAEKVLSIPRTIRAKEVVGSGFMCNYLFQNIGTVFGASEQMIAILNKITPVSEPKRNPVPTPIPETPASPFGAKIYDDAIIEDNRQRFEEQMEKWEEEQQKGDDSGREAFINTLGENIFLVCEKVSDFYAGHIEDAYAEQKAQGSRQAECQKSLEKDQQKLRNSLEQKRELLRQEATRQANSIFNSCERDLKVLENERQKRLQNRWDSGESESGIENDITARRQVALNECKEHLLSLEDETKQHANIELQKEAQFALRRLNTDKLEGSVKDRLRGFSRTIPSFLMAYGTETTTLENFDTIVSPEVFLKVSSITLDDFRFLRDGGDYLDSKTGEEKHYEGHLFDPVVFNDSIKEFMRLRFKLANYFDESQSEDIFDYIPPQKTKIHHIFTPKAVVKRMVDLLEKNQPGCFDDPEATFIDLYMKSGLFIAEIVKRLYNSKRISRLYPESEERLRHIFTKQVYGLAPTEIIFNIAKNYVLGFNGELSISEDKHNLRLVDKATLVSIGYLPKDDCLDGVTGVAKVDSLTEIAKAGKMPELLDKLFPDRD